MTSTTDSEQLDSISQKIVDLARSKPKGISDKDISGELPDLQPQDKVDILNSLIRKGLFDLFTQGGALLYKLKDPSKAKTAKGADNQEKIVYTIIEDAGNKGIWIRDIRFKSNITATQLNKILKSLETKKYVKAVKSVAASKKKVYMLYNLEPDRSVTGGAWYQDQDFEVEFVDVLNQQCYRFLEHKREKAKETIYCNDNLKEIQVQPVAEKNATFASSKDVWKFITDLKISKVKLSVEDLEMILNTLIYDGKVEKITTPDGIKLYRAINPLLDPPGLVKTPCGVCPVTKNCCDIGDVTPIKCQYICEWMDM